MRHILDDQQKQVLDHLRALVEEHKREIFIIYSEQKLRLPSHLKSITIGQLRELGANVDPDLHNLSRETEDRIRKYKSLRDKFKEIQEAFKAQVIQYYANLKKELPQELRKKQLETLNDEEWAYLGLDIGLIRKQYPKDEQDD